MRILIAGATGLIGTELVTQALDAGIGVHYLTTRKEAIKKEEHYKGFLWDPSNGTIDKAAFKDVTAIVNLAGTSVSKRWTSQNKKKIMNSRIQTAELLYNTLQEIDHVVTHYISASGISIYPNSKTRLYSEEETAVDDSFLAKVVVAWEAAADRFKELDLKVAKLRTGIVFDAEEGALPQLVKPLKLGFGALLGSGKQWQSWIHIEDIAGIYLHIIKHGLEGVYNVASPNPLTHKRLMFCIAKIIDKNIWLPNIPSFFLKLVLGEMAVLVVEGQLVSSKKIEAAGYEFHFVNPQLALEDLL
ncbi:TIGR01777 family oxidoreductase [Altibacter sp. HG106]|uniref:TIGR01777 family oxidoreductase n=1 Tax=Altibacter sp. HG106 TaxID=3023937 RepID=UPI002350CAD3|nr:TIGR01777 family oxidoreductase [Altibacter sp. HG106]MDC7995767.1 TIGR01777 family oxidoreductase [Altibacter sp. HG106]